MNQPDQTPRAAPAPSPAKPYTTPTLTIFGELALLTMGASDYAQDCNGNRPGNCANSAQRQRR